MYRLLSKIAVCVSDAGTALLQRYVLSRDSTILLDYGSTSREIFYFHLRLVQAQEKLLIDVVLNKGQ